MGDSIDTGTLLGVWAHPDDEAYLSAGLMAKARAAGHRVVVVTATRGERGTSDPHRWPPARLAARRAAELTESLAAIGVTEHRWLGHPDGACAAAPLEKAASELAAIVEAVAPDTVVTFGPEGYTGHPDHRAVSTWTSRALELASLRPLVLHATTTGDYLDRFADIHEELEVFVTDRPPATDPVDIALELRLSGTLLAAKLAALLAQASQTGPLIAAMGMKRFEDWVSTEWFVEAPIGSGTPGPITVGSGRRSAQLRSGLRP